MQDVYKKEKIMNVVDCRDGQFITVDLKIQSFFTYVRNNRILAGLEPLVEFFQSNEYYGEFYISDWLLSQHTTNPEDIRIFMLKNYDISLSIVDGKILMKLTKSASPKYTAVYRGETFNFDNIKFIDSCSANRIDYTELYFQKQLKEQIGENNYQKQTYTYKDFKFDVHYTTSSCGINVTIRKELRTVAKFKCDDATFLTEEVKQAIMNNIKKD